MFPAATLASVNSSSPPKFFLDPLTSVSLHLVAINAIGCGPWKTKLHTTRKGPTREGLVRFGVVASLMQRHLGVRIRCCSRKTSPEVI